MQHHRSTVALTVLAIALGGCVAGGIDEEDDVDPSQDTAADQKSDDADGTGDQTPARIGSGTFERVSSFGSNPGFLRMYAYSPPGIEPGAPAVFVFHGCLQRADDMRRSGWETLADQHEFLVFYGEQQAINNGAFCFNWFGEFGNTANLIRGFGENQSVASMVTTAIADFGVDPDRVFATGFSAGGALVSLLMATWPDLLAAGAINAGLPYRCATSTTGSLFCQAWGSNRSPQTWGDRVRDAFPAFSGPYPRVSIWHGSADFTVNPVNQRELMEQWTNVHGQSQQPTNQDTEIGLPRERWVAGGEVLVETVEIPGLGHEIPIDAANGCGSTQTFLEDIGVCSAFHQAEFFGLVD